MGIIKKVIKFVDTLKRKVRHQLSHWPVLYAFIGSVGVVLIWRGVWHLADDIGMSGFSSLFLGIVISITSGLFVSFFVGDSIIISGIKREKRIDEKTESEIKKEEVSLKEIKKDLKIIQEEIEETQKN